MPTTTERNRFDLLGADGVDIIAVVRPDGVYSYVSPNVETLLGFHPSEVVGRSLTDFVHPADHEKLLSAVGADIPPATIVFRLRDARGSYQWFEGTGHSNRDPDTGQVIEVLGINRCITERVRMEKQLVDAERIAAAGRVSASVVHDINNVLTAVLQSVHLAVEASDSEAVSEALSPVETAVQIATATTRQLQAIASPHASAPAPVVVDDFLNRIVPTLQRLAGGTVRVESAHEAGGAVVSINEAQMGHVLLNLILNARDANRENCHVQITSTSRGTSETRGSVTLEVRDNGPGMPPGVLAQALQPFFSTKARGSGLGLWSCNRAMKPWAGASMFPLRGTGESWLASLSRKLHRLRIARP